MDEFFKNRLSDHSEAEDGWNVPDEQIWDKVQPELPKPKKKRGAIIWLWGGLGIALMGVGYFAVLQYDTAAVTATVDPTKNRIIENTIIATEEKSDDVIDISELNRSTNIESYSTVTTSSSTRGQLKARSKDQKTDQQGRIVNQDNKASNLDAVAKIEMSNEDRSNNDQSKSISDDLSITASGEISKGENTTTEIIKRNINNISPVSYSATTYLSSNKIFEFAPFIVLPSPAVTETEINKAKKWEIGLAYSDYIGTNVPYTNFLEEDVNPMDFIRAESSYDGITFSISKRIGQKKRWSLNTGFMYSWQQIDLTIREAKIWDGRQLSRPNARTKIFPNAIDSQLYPGVVLVDGETLSLNGTLSGVGQKSLRIPIGLNYHIDKAGWELILSTGIALGVDDFGIGVGAYGIFRDGVEIGRNENGKLDGGELIHGAVFGGVSGRYHLNNNWNIGLSLNADRRIGLPSTYFRSELGIFKRF